MQLVGVYVGDEDQEITLEGYVDLQMPVRVLDVLFVNACTPSEDDGGLHVQKVRSVSLDDSLRRKVTPRRPPIRFDRRATLVLHPSLVLSIAHVLNFV